MSYENSVKAAKLAARDVLRAKQVARRLEKVRDLNITLKQYDKEIADINETTTIAQVEAEAMPAAHPRRAKAIERATELAAANTKAIESVEKRKEATEKNLAELTTEIADIESGKKKVDFEAMTALSSEFLTERYKTAFVDGEYDDDAARPATDNQ